MAVTEPKENVAISLRGGIFSWTMFLEIIPGAYDAAGKKSYKPHLKKKRSQPTFPFGRYVSRPLSVHCGTLAEMTTFLISCKQASDKETFGKDDYWLPPDEFEKSKQGDCDDFALWTWRQLMDMGYPARFVVGKFGRYGEGHAWVTFEHNGKSYIADGTRAVLGLEPSLRTLNYNPAYSVEWNGKELSFYSHRKTTTPPLAAVLVLLPSFVWFWLKFWIRVAVRLPWRVARMIGRRFLKDFSKSGKREPDADSVDATRT